MIPKRFIFLTSAERRARQAEFKSARASGQNVTQAQQTATQAVSAPTPTSTPTPTSSARTPSSAPAVSSGTAPSQPAQPTSAPQLNPTQQKTMDRLDQLIAVNKLRGDPGNIAAIERTKQRLLASAAGTSELESRDFGIIGNIANVDQKTGEITFDESIKEIQERLTDSPFDINIKGMDFTEKGSPIDFDTSSFDTAPSKDTGQLFNLFENRNVDVNKQLEEADKLPGVNDFDVSSFDIPPPPSLEDTIARLNKLKDARIDEGNIDRAGAIQNTIDRATKMLDGDTPQGDVLSAETVKKDSILPVPQAVTQDEEDRVAKEQGIKDLETQITQSMIPTSDETALQKQLDNLYTSLDLGLQNIEDEPIAMRFITGQQRSLENRANIQIASVQRNLQRLQDARLAQLKALEVQYGFKDNELTRDFQKQQLEASKTQNVFANKLNALRAGYDFNQQTGEFIELTSPEERRTSILQEIQLGGAQFLNNLTPNDLSRLEEQGGFTQGFLTSLGDRLAAESTVSPIKSTQFITDDRGVTTAVFIRDDGTTGVIPLGGIGKATKATRGGASTGRSDAGDLPEPKQQEVDKWVSGVESERRKFSDVPVFFEDGSRGLDSAVNAAIERNASAVDLEEIAAREQIAAGLTSGAVESDKVAADIESAIRTSPGWEDVGDEEVERELASQMSGFGFKRSTAVFGADWIRR